MIETARFAQIEVTSQEALREWLQANHGQQDSVWLVTWKKHVPEKYVSVSEVLDVLLSFGWIDGIRRKLDDHRTMQLIAPRQTQRWAQSYKDRAARLIADGLMQPSGFEAIENSKAQGLWNVIADVDALIIPDDLRSALAANMEGLLNFEALAPSYRRNVLRWLTLAKTDHTRTKRLATIIDHANRNARIPQM